MLTTKSRLFFLLGASSCLEPLCSDFRPLRKNPPSAIAIGGQVIKKVKKLQVLSHYFNKSLQEVSLKPQENIAIPQCRTLVVKVQGSCFLVVEESLDSSFSYEYVEDFQEQQSLKALETSFLSSSLSPRKKTEKQTSQHASLKILGKTTDSPPSPLEVSYFYNKRRTSCNVLLKEKNGPLGGVLSYFQSKKGPSTIILKLPKGKNLILQGDQVHCFLNHPKGKKIVLRVGEGSCKGQGYFSSWEIFGSKVHLELYGLKGFFKAHLTEGSLTLGFQPFVYNPSSYKISSPTFSSSFQSPEKNNSLEKKPLFAEKNNVENNGVFSKENNVENNGVFSKENNGKNNGVFSKENNVKNNGVFSKENNVENNGAFLKEENNVENNGVFSKENNGKNNGAFLKEENNVENNGVFSKENNGKNNGAFLKENNGGNNTPPTEVCGDGKNSYLPKEQKSWQYSSFGKERKASPSFSRRKRGTYCDLYVTPNVKGKLLFPQESLVYFSGDSFQKTSGETSINSSKDQISKNKNFQDSESKNNINNNINREENSNNYSKKKQKRKKTFGPYSIQIFSSGAKNIDLHYF